MKTLVSFPDDVEKIIEEYRVKNYPDLTLPKMLVRITLDQIKREKK